MPGPGKGGGKGPGHHHGPGHDPHGPGHDHHHHHHWPKGKGKGFPKGQGKGYFPPPDNLWFLDSAPYVLPYAVPYDLSEEGTETQGQAISDSASCVTQTCLENYGTSQEVTAACVCEGVRSICNENPNQLLCAQVEAELGAAISCPYDGDTPSDLLWLVARSQQGTSCLL